MLQLVQTTLCFPPGHASEAGLRQQGSQGAEVAFHGREDLRLRDGNLSLSIVRAAERVLEVLL